MSSPGELLVGADPSYRGCGRYLLKSVGVLITGYLLTALASYEYGAVWSTIDWPSTIASTSTGFGLAAAGVIVTSVAYVWLAVIGRECEQLRFFPSPTLNRLGSRFFTWKVLIGVVSFASLLQILATGNRVGWVWFLPVLLARLTLLTADPTRSKRAGFPLLFPELADTVDGLAAEFDIKAIFAQVPLYHVFGASQRLVGLLQDKQVKAQASAKRQELGRRWSALRLVTYPLRVLVREILFWGPERDIVLCANAIGCLLLSYHGSFQYALLGVCALLPFVLRSKCSRLLKEARGLLAEKQELVDEFVAQLNVPMFTYLSVVHLLALYGLGVACWGYEPLTQTTLKAETYALWFVLHCMNGFGITAGVHRLWAHRSYQAHPIVRWALMICNSVANQGSIWHWARDHIVHHRHSDTPLDPHDSNKGFFFSHVGWLIYKKDPRVVAAGRKVDMSYLREDPAVMFQKAVDPWWNFGMCFVLPGLLCRQWGESMFVGFLVAGCLRYCVMLHATWCVNSVVHAIGTKPYDPKHCTTENGWVSLLAFGEGWHNWHHAFDWDYAAAEMGSWQQYNPTKLLIDALAAVGLVWGRKRAHKVWAARKEKWSKERGGAPVEESVTGPPLFRTRVVTFGPQYDDDED